MTSREAPAWFHDLTPRAVASLGGVPVERLVHHGWTIDPSVRLGADGALIAVVHKGEGTPAVTVAICASGRDARRIEHNCECRQWGLCAHASAVLVDLSLSDELRDALVTGRDPSRALAALPRLRVAVLRALTAERIASSWVPVESSVNAAPAEFHLVLPKVDAALRSLQSSCTGFDGTPQLEVRIRLPGQRAAVDSTQARLVSFVPEDRPIVRLLDTKHGQRKVFRASGTDASLVLHLLRDRPPGRVFIDGTPDAPTFSPVPLALHIAKAKLARMKLTLSAEPEEGPFRTIQGVARGRWEDTLTPAPSRDEVVDALEARWKSADGTLDEPARDTVLFRGPYPWLWVPSRKEFHPVDANVDPDAAWHLQVSPAVELIPEHAALIYQGLRKRLRGCAVSLPSAAALGVPVEAPVFMLHVDGAPLDLTGRLTAQYGHATFALTPPTRAQAESDEKRDPELETAALARVVSAGLRWDAANTTFLARDANAAEFWAKGVPELRAGGDPDITVMIPASLAGVKVREPLRAQVRLSLSGSILDLALALDANHKPVDLDRVRKALAQKKRWVLLDDQSLAEITDTVSDLLDEADELDADELDGGLRARLSLHQFGRVERWIDATESEQDAALEGLRAKLRSVTARPFPELPEELDAELRPYQQQGVAWLQFLHAMGAGGVLADDMGLGKTVMTLALIQWRRERDGAAPTLVVCPTSVAGNWGREAARFTPGLRAVSLHGMHGEARAARAVGDVDLVVTTYALLRRDAEWLAKQRFRYVVLDEAQNIKNVDAATTKAARALKADARLALTGTPIENRLMELWSLLDFCNPGMLGSRRSFEARYEKVLAAGVLAGGATPKAIEAARVSARLRSLTRPFIMRRTKREVLDDLPPRQEIDLACALSSEHRKLYDALAAVLREEVAEFARKDPGKRPGLSMFTALLRLRQMACDPRLVDATTQVEGTKRAVFLATVKELVAEGRRALVFSQFTELLGLWRRDLEREGIAYEYLDGATVDRDGVVRRFQSGGAPLFLISLKAGGTGLNLTAADTVIHCDPWWNPAVENQATDRAHRIGQTRGVMVYRLVARGTVEDRVIALKDRKRTLADAVIAGDTGGALLAGMSAEDVVALLADANAEEG
jgi:superfamily II DNA or RNA helicase